jgi:aconitate hydratase
LLRRGAKDHVAELTKQHGAPCGLEFGGPAVKHMSVPERAVLAGASTELGAVSAIFASDERTEAYLRDQRRSKAHRVLGQDQGAPVHGVFNVDLGAVDPLVMDAGGQVMTARDVAGKPVAQVLLGGDCGVTLRDLLSTAALLKSKRIPSSLEWLVAPPSRQMLDVLAREGALADLLAVGARFIEPDKRIVTGELYGTRPKGAVGVRACSRGPKNVLVASPDSLAHAVVHGELGDPRSFKRAVRVTMPRELPTDDVLLVRDRKG